MNMNVDSVLAFGATYRTTRDVLTAAEAELVAAQRAFIAGDLADAEAKLSAARILLGLDPKE